MTTTTITERSHHPYSPLGAASTFPSLHGIPESNYTTITPPAQLAGFLFNFSYFLDPVLEAGTTSTFTLPVHTLAPLKEMAEDMSTRSAQPREETLESTKSTWENLSDEKKMCTRLDLTNKMKEAKEAQKKCKNEVYRLQITIRRLCKKIEKLEKEMLLDQKKLDEVKVTLCETKEAQKEYKSKVERLRIKIRRLCKKIEKLEKEMLLDQKKLDELKVELGEAKEALNEARNSLVKAQLNTAELARIEKEIILKETNKKNMSITTKETETSHHPYPIHLSALLKETKLAKDNELKRLRDNWGKLTGEEKEEACDEAVSNVKEAQDQQEICRSKKIYLESKVSRLCEKIEKEPIPDQKTLYELKLELDEAKKALNEVNNNLVKAQINTAKAIVVDEARRKKMVSYRIIETTLQATCRAVPLKRKADAEDDNTDGCKRRKSIPSTSGELEEPIEKSDALSPLFLPAEEVTPFSPEKQKAFFFTPLP